MANNCFRYNYCYDLTNSSHLLGENNKYYCSFDAGLADRIVDTQRYYIITDTYSSTYAPNRITEVARLDGVYARDLLREFIAAGGWSE